MKITNDKLLAISNSLSYLSGQETDAWLKVSRNIKRIQPHVESYQQSYGEIINKYVKKDEDGNPVVNENQTYDFGDNVQSVNNDFLMLVTEEIDIDFVEMTSDEITKDGKSLGLSASQMEPLIDSVIIDN